MLNFEDPTLVILAGALLAVLCALVLIWRVSARRERQAEQKPAMRREGSSAQAHELKHPAPVSQPTARAEPVATGLSYTAIAVAAAEAARVAASLQPASATPVASKISGGDDPYGIRATLPPGASYTEIAVATAEAARRARAGVSVRI